MFRSGSTRRFLLESEPPARGPPPPCQNLVGLNRPAFCARDAPPFAKGDRLRALRELGHNATAICRGERVELCSCWHHRNGSVEPGLKLAAAVTKQLRQLGRLQFRHREQLAMAEFVQVKKGERGALWFRGSGNPNGELLR